MQFVKMGQILTKDHGDPGSTLALQIVITLIIWILMTYHFLNHSDFQ